MKVLAYPKDCSSEGCKEVRMEVIKTAKSADTTIFHRKGGLGWEVLEPTFRPAGERFRVKPTKHGMAIKFKRCHVFEYVDAASRKKDKKTCTETKIVNIPQRTLDCYHDVSNFLDQIKRGKKGRPGIDHKILAAVACHTSGTAPARVSEPMTPAIISAMTELPYNPVRRSMEGLKKSGKIKCSRKQRIEFIEEEQCRVTKPYLKAFDDFIKSEKEERKWAGVRRLFGKDFVAVPAEMPKGEQLYYWEAMRKGFVPKKLSKKALKRFEKETKKWKARLGFK